MVNSGLVPAIHVSGVRCDPCGAVRCSAKARYRAVKNTTTMGCKARKQQQQQNSLLVLRLGVIVIKRRYVV